MKKITDIKPNNRDYKYYYASWHNLSNGDIEINRDSEEEKEFGIDGYSVYELDKNGLSICIADGDEASIKRLTLELINKHNDNYSLCEAIADIALEVGAAKFISIDSRLVVSLIIGWAKEFEEINAGANWGVNTELDYIEAIDQFTAMKIRDAVDAGLGYIDNE